MQTQPLPYKTLTMSRKYPPPNKPTFLSRGHSPRTQCPALECPFYAPTFTSLSPKMFPFVTCTHCLFYFFLTLTLFHHEPLLTLKNLIFLFYPNWVPLLSQLRPMGLVTTLILSCLFSRPRSITSHEIFRSCTIGHSICPHSSASSPILTPPSSSHGPSDKTSPKHQ